MNRSILALPGSLTLTALTFVLPVPAQNLLTNNVGFEANTAYYTPGWGFPEGSSAGLPGWVITLDPTGDGYAGAATNQSPQDLEGTHFGYIYSGTGSSGLLETSPASRAVVQAGAIYTLWFLARGDAAGSETLATVGLVWYPNDSNGATVGDPTNLDLTLTARVSTDDPMQTFQITAAAPPGAHYAGVRVTRPPNDYAPLLIDDFVIMAEPIEVPLSINQKGPQAVLSWPRSLKRFLEVNNELMRPNGWSPSDKPIKGIGATNYVDYPLTGNMGFFRLGKSN